MPYYLYHDEYILGFMLIITAFTLLKVKWTHGQKEDSELKWKSGRGFKERKIQNTTDAFRFNHDPLW